MRCPEHNVRGITDSHRRRFRIEGVLLEVAGSAKLPAAGVAFATIGKNLGIGRSTAKDSLEEQEFRGLNRQSCVRSDERRSSLRLVHWRSRRMDVIGTITYTKQRQIGVGEGMNSEVFIATDPQLSGEIVVKEVPKAKLGKRPRAVFPGSWSRCSPPSTTTSWPFGSTAGRADHNRSSDALLPPRLPCTAYRHHPAAAARGGAESESK